ncbi:MAG: ABC transporter permease [Candidatus Paceibacterota bacterium]|jgi:ABC-2 type transport system permease protein
MKKFLVLLKKEIRELITPQMLIPIVVMVIIFSVIGSLMSKETKKLGIPQEINLIDQDQTPTSKEVFNILEASNFKINLLKNLSIEAATKQKQGKEALSLIVIPQGFEKGINNSSPQKIEIYRRVQSFSILSDVKSSGISKIVSLINETLSNQLISKNSKNSDPQFLKYPVTSQDFVLVGDKKANISLDQLRGTIQSQAAFVPVILFMVIIMAAQMVASTVAAEKENKTFETLLSSPIGRKTIVLAKLVGSGIVALLFAAFYMIGFRSYMQGITGGATGQANPALTEALNTLGLKMGQEGYLLLGISLFIAILCALAIAIILGILAEDVKGVQVVTTPLMILIVIPYFLTLFFDINTLSPVVRYIIYAIPFSHPFLASQNIMLGNILPIILGIIYQLIVFIVFVVIASKIFSSDKVLTIRLNLRKKKLFNR